MRGVREATRACPGWRAAGAGAGRRSIAGTVGLAAAHAAGARCAQVHATASQVASGAKCAARVPAHARARSCDHLGTNAARAATCGKQRAGALRRDPWNSLSFQLVTRAHHPRSPRATSRVSRCSTSASPRRDKCLKIKRVPGGNMPCASAPWRWAGRPRRSRQSTRTSGSRAHLRWIAPVFSGLWPRCRWTTSASCSAWKSRVWPATTATGTGCSSCARWATR